MNTEVTDYQTLGAASAAALPPFADATASLFDDLVKPGTYGVVAAGSGVGKTMLLCNLAVHAAIQGRRVGVMCMEGMGQDKIQDRLRWMLGDVPVRNFDAEPAPGDWPRPSPELAAAVVQSMKAIIWRDYSKTGTTPAYMSLALPGIANAVDLLLVDGLDSVDPQFGKAYDIEAVAALLSKQVSCMPHLAVWTTSQIKVQACDTEIVRLDDLALTASKGNRSAIVIALGQRVPGSLWTACVVKDSSRQATADSQVFRFAMQPSLRFELMPVKGCGLPFEDEPHAGGEFRFVGPREDLPGESEEDRDEPDAAGRVTMPANRLYHGTDGFVPKGRRAYASAFFTNRNYEYWYWLDDLYQMAQFETAKLNAPGTSVPVRVDCGEVLTSLSILQRRWQCDSTKPVRTFLEHAVREDLIRVEIVEPDSPRVADANTRPGTRKVTKGKNLCQIIILRDYYNKLARGSRCHREKGHNDRHNDSHDEGTTQAQEGHTTE